MVLGPGDMLLGVCLWRRAGIWMMGFFSEGLCMWRGRLGLGSAGSDRCIRGCQRL